MGYCGLSCVVGPDGQDLARAGSAPALLFADIDPSAISRGRKANPYLSEIAQQTGCPMTAVIGKHSTTQTS
jgi:predicted amidohydrolase